MIGETVTVQRRKEVGRDRLNEPVYEWVDEDVDDVLVAPGPRSDLPDPARPDGVEVVWSLYWPKAYTASLRGCRVIVRGGEPCRIVGDPQPYPDVNTPTRWNRPSEAARVEG